MSDTNAILTKEEYIANAKKSYSYFAEQAAFFKDVVESNGGVIEDEFLYVPKAKIHLNGNGIKKRKPRHGYKKTFSDTIVDCLRETDRAMLVGELMNLAKLKGRTATSSSNFGSQLNSASKSSGDFLRDNIEGRVYWGLPSWFKGGHLLDSFVKALKV